MIAGPELLGQAGSAVMVGALIGFVLGWLGCRAYVANTED